MMGSAIAIIKLKGAFVQENGIIRLSDGRFIGRLEGIDFEDVKAFEIEKEKSDK